MTSANLEILREPSDSARAQGCVCALCSGGVTCPMLRDGVWQGISPRPGRKNDYLCLECAERRLGRSIVIEDLATCPMNYAVYLLVERSRRAE